MAAPSPRKPRTAKGRHRKPAKHTHWLAAGAVGVGLASALVSGPGVAAADTGDSTSSQNDSGSRGGKDRGERAERVSRAGGSSGSGSSTGAGSTSGSSRPDRSAQTGKSARADQIERKAAARVGRTPGSSGTDTNTGGLGDTPGSGAGQTSDVPNGNGNTGGSGTGSGAGSGADLETPGGRDGQTPTDPAISPQPETPNGSDPSAGQPNSSQPPTDGGPTGGESAPEGDNGIEPGGNGTGGGTTPPVTDTVGVVTDDDDDPVISDVEDTSGGTGSSSSPAEYSPEQLEAARVMITLVRELLSQMGLGGDDSVPTSPVGILFQALYVSSRKYDNPFSIALGTVRVVVETVVESGLAELNKTVGVIPGVGTVLFAASALYDAVSLLSAVIRLDVEDINDELQDLARDALGMIPFFGSKLVADKFDPESAAIIRALFGAGIAANPNASAAERDLAAADASALPQGDVAGWNWVVQRALQRLLGWPGTPKNFTDISNTQTDHTLDAINDQLEAVIATALLGSPARWLTDLLGILGSFFAPAVPGFTFTDTLNAWGEYLNLVAPPFEVADGADTLGIITPYKMMGAAVVGAATVLKDMLNGVYDMTQIEIDVIKATTGANVTASDLNDFGDLAGKVVAGVLADGGAFMNPERAWQVTLPAWTNAQTNPYTLAIYVGLVAVYKRFQEMARFTEFTTWTTYDSWNYTISLFGVRSQYAAGTFHVVDDLGRPVTWIGVSQGGTYTSEGGALVTINTAQGGFTYTQTAPGDAFFHRSTSENEADRYDTVYVPVKSADGVTYTVALKVLIIDGSNANPTGSVTLDNGGTADALGVVRGKVNGSDSDGDTLTYRLVESSVNGLSGNSAYTKNGSGNGGIVTIDPNTGKFTYVSSATASGPQTFQVEISDGHYGRAYVNVTVNNSPTVTPANVTKPSWYTFNGSVPTSAGVVFTSYALAGNPSKGTVTSFDPLTGTFTYVRNSGLGHSTTANDVVTVIATDANGRTVTLQVQVQPDVPNAAPVIDSSTTNVGSSNSNDWGLNTSTWTQRTTGKITASDADGDNLTYTLVGGTTTNGGTVTFNADGSWVYTITKNQAYFHGAARIGASGNQVADTFTVEVSDGFGGVAHQTVNIAIYAVNSAPTLSLGSLVCAFSVCTITITTTDPDGDDLSGSLATSNNGTGRPWYTLERGSVTANAGNQHTMSWTGNSNGAGTQQTGNQRYTVYDGYYRVNNGIVDTSYFSRAWVNWSGTTRTTGN